MAGCPLGVDAVEKVEKHRKSRESRFFGTAAAARYSGANTKAGGRFRMNRCGFSGRRARSASAVFKIFVLHPKKTFSTASVMCGRRPHCKKNLTCGLRSGA